MKSSVMANVVLNLIRSGSQYDSVKKRNSASLSLYLFEKLLEYIPWTRRNRLYIYVQVSYLLKLKSRP